MGLYKNFNTPIQRLNEQLNGNEYYIKRDDLIPFSFGGNKVRKAVLFFEDLLIKEFNCVVTYGSSSSNHCRVIANIAASQGIPCHIISPIESNYTTSNSELVRLLGASVTTCSVKQVKAVIENKLNELKLDGLKPYFIEGGGHGDFGTHSYVKAYEEIREYERETSTYFDFIFHTSGTGTTQAGLICGALLNKDNTQIIGISNARRNPYGSRVVLESVNSYLMSIGREGIGVELIKFIDDFVLNGYGSYNDQIKGTVKQLLRQNGIPLDLTYTGKGYWGMKQYIYKNEIKNKNILFIHTGGTPLFFDKLEDFL